MQPSLREAAVLLSCLPERYVQQVLARLGPEDARVVGRQLAEMTDASGPERRRVVQRFLRENGLSAPAQRFHRVDAAEPPEPLFHFLHPLEPTEIARLIGQELPRTQAIILTQLSPRLAAEVLAQLPHQQRVEVVQQLATLDDPSPAALPEIARALRQIVARRSSPSIIAGRQLLTHMLDQTHGTSHQLLTEALQQVGVNVSGMASARDTLKGSSE